MFASQRHKKREAGSSQEDFVTMSVRVEDRLKTAVLDWQFNKERIIISLVPGAV